MRKKRKTDKQPVAQSQERVAEKVPSFSPLFWLVFLGGLAWTFYLFSLSPGVPVQDEIGHFLFSRNSWNYPILLLDVWGRPVNTLLYMVPSLWGLNGARLFSLALACLTVLITAKTSQKLGSRLLFLAPLFLWFQPWFCDLSYTAITEVPFSLFLILGIYLCFSGKETIASVFFGMLPLVRHEGIMLLGLWGLYLLCRLKWKAIIVSLSAVLLYNIIYFACFRQFAASVYMSSKPTTLYGSGTWFHFVWPLVKNAGVPVFAMSLLALRPLAGLRGKALIILVPYLAYFAVHTVLFKFGLYASGGYELFLLPMAPGLAVAAVLGVEDVCAFSRDRIKDPRTWKIFRNCFIAAIAVTTLMAGFNTRPRPIDLEGALLKQAAASVQKGALAGNKVIATHVWFYYFYDMPWSPDEMWGNPPSLEGQPPGTIVVWDAHYSDRWGLPIKYLLDPQNGWEKLGSDKNNIVAVFRKAQNQ